ncbi:FAD-dependent oxidoreductase [Microbacterium sp. STN6]|uniref:NAD(P)/FAD-dependent oxidoreductase n=1 Tax=Microbacterium sp. STN6 TaxID=2995588 RepID=UPI0022609C01|nr:FAD-dependent oxidoreductase [Microbacterium sp. STN6]MCX7523405.1 FAD-dependent oxidoreductase [Microbacterium sp. STN6]
MAETKTFTIVGGGLAGATAAATLREEGFDGRIRLYAGEAHQPYIRPPLSKEYLTGQAEAETAFVNAEGWYAEHDIDLVTATSVSAIDPAAHRIELADGTAHEYDRLLLATGASARRLSVPGAELPGVHHLRTLDDSERLRSALAEGGRRVVIVGAGWIGLEVAAAARGYGNDVVVVGTGDVPLESALGPELGAVFARLHTDNGVELRLPGSVTAIEGDDHVTGVQTDAGSLPADIVVAGIGAIPETSLALAAGLDVQNGILTDASLRTSAPDVFAAGDVANTWHPVLNDRLRSEHWANAIGQGKAAAKAMLGQSVSYDDIPYFYTDQFDLGMEYSGYIPLTVGADVVYRGDLETREFIAFWLREGRVVAGMNVNVWDVNEDVQALIRSGRQVDAARLRDANVPLGEV